MIRDCIRQFIFIIFSCLWQINLSAMSLTPACVVTNPCPHYSLINSVDCHPKKNLFCVTYTQGNRVVIYKNSTFGVATIVQTLSNPLARLSDPQHAVFSPNGKKLVVANWTNETVTIYETRRDGLFCEIPASIIPSPDELKGYKPHGITISPCGTFLAIAYGVTHDFGRAIAIFRMNKQGGRCKLIHALKGKNALPGIPKGITFSPDGSCLLVTFSDLNSLMIFGFDRKNQMILPTPRQTLQGFETQISRPEDIKISPDGRYCATSNSDKHTVTFYPFDTTSNRITQSTPSYILQNPEATLCFPHGIAFSPDGRFLFITNFGPIGTTNDGGIFWSSTMQPDASKVNIYTSSN